MWSSVPLRRSLPCRWSAWRQASAVEIADKPWAALGKDAHKFFSRRRAPTRWWQARSARSAPDLIRTVWGGAARCCRQMRSPRFDLPPRPSADASPLFPGLRGEAKRRRLEATTVCGVSAGNPPVCDEILRSFQDCDAVESDVIIFHCKKFAMKTKLKGIEI